MRSAIVCLAALVWLSPTAGAACTGDCDGDRRVAIDELVLSVDVALDGTGVERCPAADRDGNGAVSIDELVVAVAAALGGCPTPTPSATPTRTPDPELRECGDGVAQPAEECDDANRDPGDGCDPNCELEPGGDACAGVAAYGGEGVVSELVAEGLDMPVHVAAPPLDPRRVFIVEQRGRIRVVKDGTLLDEPFLAITDRVGCCGERGLLSVAFHPRYESNGRFFVNYTNRQGHTVLARYVASADPDRADGDSEAILLTINQPFPNHNGGQLAFGPDGYLYVGMGDGGGGGDPRETAQDDTSLLGKLLRLDVDVDAPPYYAVPPTNPDAARGAPLGLIWAKGLRNPWRFAFDRSTGDLYIGDVGQGRLEEIDVQPAASPGGENYGWDVFEGTSCFEPAPLPVCPDPSAFVPPVFEYDHATGCSVTGGFVYRGCALPALRGEYFFSDYCQPWVRSLRVAGGAVTGPRDWTDSLAPRGGRTLDAVSSFGEDARGELYIADHDGQVFTIAPAPCDPPPDAFALIQHDLFDARGCAIDACHGRAQVGGVDLRAETSYANLAGVPSSINPDLARVAPGDAQASVLFLKLASKTLPDRYPPSQTGAGGAMPPGTAPAFSPAELEAVRLWIDAGAPATGAVAGVSDQLGICASAPR